MKCNNCGYEFFESCFCPQCGKKNEEYSSDNNALNFDNSEVISNNNSIKTNIENQEELSLVSKELEIARLKLEQAKIEKERLEIEEQNRIIQQETLKIKEKEDKIKAELTSRTYRDVLYNSVDEMEAAKKTNEKNNLIKRANIFAILSFIISLIPLTFIGAYFFWATSIASVILGVLALKGKTNKRGFAIAGLVITGIFLVIIVITIIICIYLYM